MNPYIIIGSLVAFIGVGLGSFFYGHHIGYVEEKAILDKFVSDTKETGLKQQRDNAILEKQQGSVTHSLEIKHEANVEKIKRDYTTELARVRQSARTHSRGVSTLADSAKGLCSGVSTDDAVARLADLETGILGILEKGDREIQRRSEMSEWLKAQGFKAEQ